ncbi:hypothetical protein KFE25_003012 [Diacronema lutheri]|uniref:WD40 repeat-containing protein SMU1 n=1 Tax=Diacronema lutheri TaxID=2081491 RepID=A0A8J5XPP1_DIALT|nr:hypothetical protein KFE25_003012 [Diacronema lutheri]
MDAMGVEGADIVRVLLQFLQENGLTSTYAALQEEAQVSLNAVESVDAFARDVREGRWDAVLQVVATLALPRDKLLALYEQLVLELAERRESNAARQVLRSAEPLVWLQAHEPDAYKRLELLASKPFFDAREAYPEGSTREGRRAALAELLIAEVVEAPPSRLLALIGQALKWQRLNGLLPHGAAAAGKVDLLRNMPPVRMREEEACPTRTLKEVSFGKRAHPEIARFSPDGLWLVTGSSDGFVEVREPESGRLSKALRYQADDALMMHDAAVLCLDFSRDAELLATGCQGGHIKVWRLSHGQCARKLAKAHEQGVTCLAFSRDGSQLASGSFDGTARLHGLRSGKALREFRGHGSYVNDVLWSADGTRLVTASSDGTARVWDARTAECTCTLRPPQPTGVASPAISAIALWPANAECVAVCARSCAVHLLTLSGKLVRSFEAAVGTADFVHCAVSPRGEWLYCAGADQQLHCFCVESGKLERSLKACSKDMIGAAHHPFRNIVATWAFDGLLKLWVP